MRTLIFIFKAHLESVFGSRTLAATSWLITSVIASATKDVGVCVGPMVFLVLPLDRRAPPFSLMLSVLGSSQLMPCLLFEVEECTQTDSDKE